MSNSTSAPQKTPQSTPLMQNLCSNIKWLYYVISNSFIEKNVKFDHHQRELLDLGRMRPWFSMMTSHLLSLANSRFCYRIYWLWRIPAAVIGFIDSGEFPLQLSYLLTVAGELPLLLSYLLIAANSHFGYQFYWRFTSGQSPRVIIIMAISTLIIRMANSPLVELTPRLWS